MMRWACIAGLALGLGTGVGCGESSPTAGTSDTALDVAADVPSGDVGRTDTQGGSDVAADPGAAEVSPDTPLADPGAGAPDATPDVADTAPDVAPDLPVEDPGQPAGPCESDDDCTGQCVAAADDCVCAGPMGQSECLGTCTSDLDCAQAGMCDAPTGCTCEFVDSGHLLCVASCTTAMDCEQGYSCVDGTCEPGNPPDPSDAGGSGDVSFGDEGPPPPDGMSPTECVTNADCTGSACPPFNVAGCDCDDGVCKPLCTTDDDCPPGVACEDPYCAPPPGVP